MSSSELNPDVICWLDIETTGLDPLEDYILEMAFVLTDNRLNVIKETNFCLVFDIDEWLSEKGNNITSKVYEMHVKSGLLGDCKNIGLSDREVRLTIADFMYYSTKWDYRGAILAGNNVSFDRSFLKVFYPVHERELFHYRNLDVSSIKEFYRRFYPSLPQYLKPENIHRAMDDIKASIKELRFYIQQFDNQKYPDIFDTPKEF